MGFMGYEMYVPLYIYSWARLTELITLVTSQVSIKMPSATVFRP